MKRPKHTHESGYALLGLLVAMTIGLVVLSSTLAKPTAQFVTQRDNEEEMFFRGQNVTEAIVKYAALKGGGLSPQAFPTKLEDLLQEFNVQGRTLHIVRGSSLVDPLTGKEWRAVRLGDPLIGEFYRTAKRAIDEQIAAAVTGGGAAAQQAAQLQQQLQFLTWAAVNSGVTITNLNQDADKEETATSSTASGFTLDGDNRPIVAIVSTFKKPLIRKYFGVATTDKALLISGIQTPLVGYGMGGTSGGGGAPGNQNGVATDPIPDTAPKIFGGRCPPGSTDPTCPRNWNLGNNNPQK